MWKKGASRPIEAPSYDRRHRMTTPLASIALFANPDEPGN